MPPTPAPLGPAPDGATVASIPMGRAQELLWTGQRLRPGVPLYNMVLAFEIEGELDEHRFEQAYRALIASSDALRTRIGGGGTPRARVAASSLDAPHRVIDLSDEADPEAAARRWAPAEAARLFTGPLEDAWLVSSALLRLGPARSVWFLGQHHVISDAWSTSLCFDRLARFYGALERGEPLEVDAGPDYRTFVEHESRVAETASYRRAARFWDERGVTAAPASFYGRSLPPRPSARTERVSVVLGRDLSTKLREASADPRVRGLTEETSCFHLFAAALAALRLRVGGEAERPGRVSMLAPVHNRSKRSFKETIGVFIEVLPMEVEVPPGATFADLAQGVRAGARDLFLNALPGVSAGVDARGHGLVLNYITSGFGDFAGRPATARWIHPGHGDANHALRVQVHDFGGTGAFQVDLDMHCDVFGPRERELAPVHLERLLVALAGSLDARVEDVPLLDEAEERAAVVDFQEGAQAPSDGDADTVVAGFRRAVALHPARVAVEVAGGETQTFEELAARVDVIRAELAACGISHGALVALVLERSIDFVASVLAILECGAAYAPFEPGSPPERLARLLDTCMPDLVIARSGARVGSRPVLDPAAVSGDAAGLAGPSVEPAALAYVLHTSGSTGVPKGTEITHASLWNYLRAARAAYGFDAEESRTAALFTSVAVDMTVTSLFLPLVSGGTLRVQPAQVAESDLAVLDVFDEGRCHLVKLTPSHLTLLLQRGGLRAGRLDTLVVGGEDFPGPLARAAQDALGAGVAIHNEYGPTEATVACMLHRYDAELDTGASVPIGRPFAGARIHVVDGRDRPVPPGVAGEVLIGGPGVARGYRGRADETGRAFTADPFAARLGDPGARVYRTGDLARRDPATGDLVYLGRRDEQVKVRGHRVELGEVRAALVEHPSVSAAEVVARRIERAAPAAASDLLDLSGDPRWEGVTHCVRCGLASNHPEARLDDEGVCAVCREFEDYRDAAEAYFRTPDDLRAELPRRPGQEHDCIALLSGGKDSTYALYQLVQMGLRPLVFSLDNGFISEGAKANIRRVVDHLGLELVFASTPSMNAIFADSLARFSNVCQGCFKTIWTLATELAKERGIDRIVTGLSRGQIFETRLAPIFRTGIREPEAVDAAVIEARRAYHRVDDAVSRHLDVGLFTRDEIFDEVRYVDFYRYHDVPLEEVLRFIGEEAAWRRPEDTGRSTNCLINDVGIAVHKKTRGYHNYALPYSWDVRLGHKTRDECLDELNDEIDAARVDEILREVGAADAADERGGESVELAAYVVLEDGATEGELREHLEARLTAAMIPSRIVALDALPLAPSGKVDRARLPDPDEQRNAPFEAPEGEIEEALAALWCEVLSLERVGRRDHFLHVGGDSILGLQIVTRARTRGLGLAPRDLFDTPTIAELARVARRLGARSEGPAAEPFGPTPLTPIQRWYLDAAPVVPGHFAMSMVVELAEAVTRERLEAALVGLVERHPVLGATFRMSADGWSSEVTRGALTPRVVECSEGELEAALEQQSATLDLESGALLAAAMAPSAGGTVVGIAVHHLVIDAVSWEPLLHALIHGLAGQGAVVEPCAPWRAWAVALEGTRGYASPDRGAGAGAGAEGEAWTVQAAVEAGATAALEERAREAGAATMEERSLAALGLALAAHGEARGLMGEDGVLTVDVEAMGRHREELALDVARTVGWFTEFRSVDLDTRDEGAALTSAARAARRAPGDATVLFNDLGTLGGASGGAELRVIRGLQRHRASAALRTHPLEVHLTREGGSLRVHLRATDTVLSRAAAQAVVKDIAERLAVQVSTGPAAADFAGSGLNQDDLDDLLGDLGDL